MRGAVATAIDAAVVLREGALDLEQVLAVDPLRKVETLVEVCPPVFIDPEGVRLRG